MKSERRVYNADIETVSEIMDYIAEQTGDFPEKASYDLKLACEEILVNIANYAYPEGDGQLAFLWEDDKDNRKVTVAFEDSGIPFNPLLLEDPILNVPIKARKIGGLGIMMVRKLMDAVEYAYSGGKNILTITKKY
jgi:anti-sigma regulatory factor (Ser/Thr protein kinase)